MKQIQWGIIGCGDVTEVKSGPAFNKVRDSRLVAVMRRNASLAEDYAKRHSVPKWYSNAHDLINDPDVNAIYIATPPLQHEEYTIASLEAGKPVYVEKPMALNAEAGKKMVDAAIENKLPLSVAHYRRAQPLFLKLKDLLHSQIIGDIKFIDLKYFAPAISAERLNEPKVKWRVDPKIAGGGLFHDLAPHQLDLMVYFFGKTITSQGISRNQAGLYDADDIVTGNIVFENGIIFNGIWCFTVPQKEAKDTCEIIGTQGKISFSVFGEPVIVITKEGATETIQFDKLQHVQQPLIEKVVQYFLGNGENPSSGEEATEVLRIMESFTRK